MLRMVIRRLKSIFKIRQKSILEIQNHYTKTVQIKKLGASHKYKE